MWRFSSKRVPQLLQKRARRWFFSPQRRQRSHSLRDGIARNRPSLPSISLTSRMTNVLSNVSEQNAFRRLPPANGVDDEWPCGAPPFAPTPCPFVIEDPLEIPPVSH